MVDLTDCQSCGMPVTKKEDFGTNMDRSKKILGPIWIVLKTKIIAISASREEVILNLT